MADKRAPTAEDGLPPRTPDELVEYLGISERTLRQWRWQDKGPRWVKVGRHIRYPRPDTQRWLDAGADSPKQALASRRT
jgi:excisionase family DNA binding protein